MKKMNVQAVILASSLALFQNTVNAKACESIHSINPLFLSKASNQDLTRKLYTKGIDPKKNADKFIQFSYESEYLFSESAPILRDYAPNPKEMKTAEWLALSDVQRVNWLQQKFKDKPEFVTGSGLYKIVKIDFLPQELAIDSTGNVEIIIHPPLSTYAEWKSVVDQIVERYGAGSQQAMVSKARESAFASQGRDEKLEKQHLGWLVYTNVFDMFQKMKSGAERFKKDPTKLTAQSFDHPFLGPMTKLKRDVMEKYISENAKLNKYDDDSKMFVRKSDASFKYTSGPSYRPDIAGPVKWAWEIRNAHKDVGDLQNKVLRDINAHVTGLDSYEKFAGVPAFDSIGTFEKLPQDVQKLFQTLFPSKADPRFEYHPDERLALETFRNFSMPAGDFSILARVLSVDATQERNLAKSILKARTNYINQVALIANLFSTKKINQKEASARVQGLLNTWAVESGLVESFESFASRIGDDPEFMFEMSIAK